jgi:carboxypeptidase family protein
MVRRLLVLAWALALLPQAAAGQARVTGADIVGTVRDESGAVLPAAEVTVVNQATNLTRTVVTDARGRYLVAALPPGTYRLKAHADGFASETREGLVLVLGQSAEADVTLKLASQAESIAVVAEAPLVDPAHTALSSVINQEQIDSLPINGRNFIGFSIITPGVTTDRTPQQGASATSGLSFGGQRARSNNIMVDGYDNNDHVVGAVRAVFSQEAVREFQVLTNSYSAEFGKASGGVVNIVTKSGTNALAGNAFMYFRDESLNAKDHFEKFDVFGTAIERSKAPYSQIQWGGTLGGPIKRDKTFFFASFEKLDVEASNFVTIDSAAAATLQANGFPVELGNVPYDYRFTQAMVKADHQWSSGHSLSARGHFSDVTNENVEPFGGIVARSRGAVQLRTDWSVAASQLDILSPRWVNESRVYFARVDQEVNSLDPRCGGPCNDDFKGGPTLEVSGIASVGRQRFTPNPRKGDTLQAAETISFSGANHGLKAGLEYNLDTTASDGGSLPLHFGGRYIFAPLPAVPALGIPAPITALQALQLGLPAAYVQGYGNPDTAPTYHNMSAFIQDDWRLSNVTVKLGLRYQKQFWPGTQYNVPAPGGTRLSYTFPDDNNNFAPRLAIAWDPGGDRRTSIHGAYGLFYDNHITSLNGVTDILDGSQGVRTLVLQFPNSIAAWRAPGQRLPEPATPYPSLIFNIDPDLKTPYAQHVSAGVDRAISATMSFAANVVYFRGKHQVGTIDYNPVVPALGAARRPNDINGIPGTSASVLQYTSFGETWYKGLTLSVNKRLSANYEFLASYTLSKAEDNSTDFQSAFIPENNGLGRDPANLDGLPLGFNPDSERGPANHDQRHRFVISGFYQFPAGILVSSILTAASGRPFTPLAGFDWNGDGNGGAFPSDRARRTPGPIGTVAVDSVGRNSETMDKQIIVDLRVSKKVRVREAAIEGIFEVFNLFNRANYSEINNIFGGGAFPNQPVTDAQGRVTYGRYEQALAPLQMQLAVKLSF